MNDSMLLIMGFKESTLPDKRRVDRDFLLVEED
jgi:hypothetical protein